MTDSFSRAVFRDLVVEVAAKTAEVMMGHLRQFFATDTSRVVCEVESMRLSIDSVAQSVKTKPG